MAIFTNRRPPRRIVSSNLSANYVKFRHGQMVLIALTIAVFGLGTAALALAWTR